MTLKSRLFNSPLLRRSAVAVAVATACAGAWADTPPFTLDPAGAGLTGGSVFTADNILVSDYSKVTLSGSTFTDTGYLSIIGFQSGDTLIAPTGLNSSYGMYIAFSGTGTTTPGDPTMQNTSGVFTDLSYTLYGYNGTATFGLDASNTPYETAVELAVLATGSLVSGSVATTLAGTGPQFSPSATASLTFMAGSGAGTFFQSPSPFYDLAFAAFTNTTSQVVAFNGGFAIQKGGGAFNFGATPPIPEPETYALLLAGLGAVGFVARRRRAA